MPSNKLFHQAVKLDLSPGGESKARGFIRVCVCVCDAALNGGLPVGTMDATTLPPPPPSGHSSGHTHGCWSVCAPEHSAANPPTFLRQRRTRQDPEQTDTVNLLIFATKKQNKT